MRKHIAVVMAVIMALSICGCGSSKSLFPENTGEQQETKTADSGSMKVGYLLSSDGDAPDTVARVQGIRKMQEQTGIKDDQIIIKESVKKSDCEKKAAELAEKGCSIIFSENPEFEGVLEETNRLKPILGKVKAGYDLWADQDVEGYLEVGKGDAERGDYFLRVVGDSMVGSHIYEDDLVFVQQCNKVNTGDIAVVMIDEEVTIKTVYFKNNILILAASNLKYEDRYFDQEEIERRNIQIIGKVLFVRKDFV